MSLQTKKNNKIVVFSYGDSNSASTWSNVPFLFCRSLERQGFNLERVDFRAHYRVRHIWFRIVSKIFDMLQIKQSLDFSHSRLCYFIAMRKIRRAIKKHRDSCCNLFFSYYFADFSQKTPTVLWSDWSKNIEYERGL